MVGYEGVNQQKIYNPRTKKINISAFVWFDISFNYYNIIHEVIDKDKNDTVLGDIQNEVDDKEFGKIIARKQVIKKDAILAYSTLQSQKKSVVTDSEKERYNNSLFKSTIDNNYLLPNQLILSLIVLKLFADWKKAKNILGS